MTKIFSTIAQQNELNYIEAQPLSGGDINEVFLLKCDEGNFVVKLNDSSKFPGMFEAEAKGLELLESSNSFVIPEVMAYNSVKNQSYLLMEYIDSRPKQRDFWKIFSSNLSTLHKTTAPTFGLDHNNYIGSLPQKNNPTQNAPEFYISQRLEPQFEIAINNGHKFKLSPFYQNIFEEIPLEPPALIHGDLWGGNFMVSEKGLPVLIDPAVAFAPREMDVAMMKLFGGFAQDVYRDYNDEFPLIEEWEKRIPIWQLYYLLVHLNLFGAGYLTQVKEIIARYS